MRHKYLHVETKPYTASYDQPEDCFREFVHEAFVEIRYSNDDDDDDDEVAEEVGARLDVIIVRGICRNDNINVWEMADAHSGEAEQVASFLLNSDSDEFHDKFDTMAEYANSLLIDDANLGVLTTEEIRKFVRRAFDQFDVDLIFIRQEDESLARHFLDFFEKEGPFLIHPKAHHWPTSECAPEPVITSIGGQA